LGELSIKPRLFAKAAFSLLETAFESELSTKGITSGDPGLGELSIKPRLLQRLFFIL
jgi:hypothetical protein